MALPERYANFGTSTLSGDITSDATVLAVASPSTFPGSGQFRLKIENELILVNTVNGNIFDSLQRGIEGTTPAAHTSGVAVYHVVTAGGLSGVNSLTFKSGCVNLRPATGNVGHLYFSENVPVVWRDPGFGPWRGIYQSYPIVEPPPLSAFTWLNQGGSTVVSSGGIIYLQVPAGAGDNLRGMIKPIRPAPYTYKFIVMPHFAADNNTRAGIILYESGTGELISLHHDTEAGGLGATDVAAFNWNSVTSFNSLVSGASQIETRMAWYSQGMWIFRIRDDGVNRIFESSRDHMYWQTIGVSPNTTFSTPNNIGFFCNNFGSTEAIGLTLFSWEEMDGAGY